MRILIAAGGTGGHIYPALAVLDRLRSRLPHLELRWIGGRRGLEGDIVQARGLSLDRLWLRSLRTVDASLDTLLDPLRLLASVPQAGYKLLRWRPDVIFTTGGYVAIPILVAAAVLRIPSLLWEGNQIPGRSVRLSARLATTRTVSYAATRAQLPDPIYLTGTPIRDLRRIDRSEARQRLGLPEGPPVLLVFGGSQSVRRLDDAVAGAIADLVERCVVIHITGAASIERAERARSALPESRRARYHPFAFLHEDMDAALTAADLLVGRAGSSTLAEAAAAGVPMIVIPYPHAAAHQKANAAEMVSAGAAVLVDDAQLDGDTLRQACELLFDPRLESMAVAARSMARPGSATATGLLLERLAGREPLPSQEQLDALVMAPT